MIYLSKMYHHVLFVLFIFLFQSNLVRSQTSSFGLVAYYFWIENPDGSIQDQTISKPYYQSKIIQLGEKGKQQHNLTIEQVQGIIMQFAHDTRKNNQRKRFKFENQHVILPLNRQEANHLTQVVYIQRNGKWSSQIAKPVVYFNQNNHALFFEKSSDTIILNTKSYPSLFHAQVIHNEENNTLQLYNYEGINIASNSQKPTRLMLFINGYRGFEKENDPADFLLTTTDRYHYWYKIDDQFIQRFHSVNAYYIDASVSLKTSSHKNVIKFTRSYFRVNYPVLKSYASKQYHRLNLKPNEKGFYYREDLGKIGGLSLFYALQRNNITALQDTIDIVCHSMGYAYTLGLIQSLEGKVVFGKLYIIAPEGASVDGADWSKFMQVIQYGSNLDQQNPDALIEQDGIAPQIEVKNLFNYKQAKTERVFLPNTIKKGFVDSHMLYSYDWIFEIPIGQIGSIFK